MTSKKPSATVRSLDFGNSETTPIARDGRPSQAAILEMVAAERDALLQARSEHGDFSQKAASHAATLRLLIEQAQGMSAGPMGAMTPIDLADQLADVFRFEIPASHRRHVGPIVTHTKKLMMKGLEPFHVEVLRPQAEFNRALVEVLRTVLASQGLGSRDWVRQRLGSLSDPTAWRLKSHRKNFTGKMVEFSKASYLKTFGSSLGPHLHRQRQWNESVIKLLEVWKLGEPENRAEQLLSRVESLADPMSDDAGGPLSFMWKELLRRQVQFNKHVSSLLKGTASIVPSLAYEDWVSNRQTLRGTAAQESIAQLTHRPLVTVVITRPGPTLQGLSDTVESVRQQIYGNWELVAFDAPGTSEEVSRGLKRLVEADSRLRLVNEAQLESSLKGEWVAFVQGGEQLAPNALFEVVATAGRDREIEVLYSDEDVADEEGRSAPFFKPDFTYELLTSTDYLSRLLVVRRSLLDTVGLGPISEPAYRYDLSLRVTEHTNRVRHLDEVLVSCPPPAGKAYQLPDGAAAALERHFKRTGKQAHVSMGRSGLVVSYPPASTPLVSIIVPFKDKPELLRQLLESMKVTTYTNYELLLISNNSVLPETHALLESIDEPRIKKLVWDHPFNYPAINNFGAMKASGELLLFLNNDIEIIQPDWLTRLVGHLQQPGVGAVGPKLLFPNRKIQHAGVVLGMGGFAGHVFAELPDDGAYTAFGSTDWSRNYLALTSACVALTRDQFEALQGFDERFIVCGSDVDLCLRLVKAGKRVVYEAGVTLIHHESATRRADQIPVSDFWESFRAYREYLSKDPFYSRHLTLSATVPTLRQPGEANAAEVALQVLAAQENVGTVSSLSGGRLAFARQVQGMAQTLDYRSSDLTPKVTPALSGPPKRITWFLPYFNHPFGGVHTILRFAHLWRRRFGVESNFIIYDNPHVTAREMTAKVNPIFDQLPGQFEVLKSVADLERLPETDVAIATLWTSAYFVLQHRLARFKAYFIQDYEPQFYPAGSMSALSENTYKLGFYGLFNTVGLHDYVTRNYPMEGTWFEPSVDHEIFHAKGRSAKKGPVRIFFYGRPSTDRNAFELGIESLRRVKQYFGSEVQIISAGEAWNPSWFNAEGIIENLAVLPYRDTASLYRSIDIGLCFMFTKHPSYLPLEMMACGVTVVTNENPANAWLLKHGENCLLAQPTVSCVAEQLIEAVEEALVRERIGRTAAQRMESTTWEDQAAQTFEALSNHCMLSNRKRLPLHLPTDSVARGG